MANGILSGIGQGLRTIGGALSPEAFAQEGAQRENIRGIEANKASQTRAILINAIMQGAMDPEKGAAILAKMGVNVPGIGLGVQAQQLQRAEQDRQREAAKLERLDKDRAQRVAEALSGMGMPAEEIVEIQKQLKLSVPDKGGLVMAASPEDDGLGLRAPDVSELGAAPPDVPRVLPPGIGYDFGLPPQIRGINTQQSPQATPLQPPSMTIPQSRPGGAQRLPYEEQTTIVPEMKILRSRPDEQRMLDEIMAEESRGVVKTPIRSGLTIPDNELYNHITSTTRPGRPAGPANKVEAYKKVAEAAFAAGDYKQAEDALALANELEDPVIKNNGGTETERAFRYLIQLQNRINNEQYEPTQEEIMRAQAAQAILNKQRAQLDPNTGQLFQQSPIDVPDSLEVGRPGERTPPTLPKMTSGRKPVPAAAEKDLLKMGDAHSQMQKLVTTFKPEYGGFVLDVAGKARLAYARKFGGPDLGLAEWHQGYEQWATDVRAAKFGMALTGPELAQFEKFRVNIGDSPDVIKANLQRQVEIASEAINRRKDALKSGGYNAEQIDALTGDTSLQGQGSLQVPMSPDVQSAEEEFKKGNISAEQLEKIYEQYYIQNPEDLN